jgi:hypothetical protein
MPLRDTVNDSWENIVDRKTLQERIYVFPFGPYKRNRTIVTSEFICLTYNAAKTYADCHVTDTYTSFQVVEANRVLNEYKLIKNVDSFDTWVGDV